jgi:Asp-tRNA(Asn)/Glu-tRNA(Gln) amidotransferase B subunit
MSRQDFASIISAEDLAQLVNMIMLGDISRTNAKIVFDQVVETGRSVASIVKEQEMTGAVTIEDLGGILTQILSNSPELAADYRADKISVSNYIIGQVKAITNGKALAKDILAVLDDMFDNE